MELFLDNVGIIKESSILLNGLTVITGKNSSGKTTVGKIMYSLLSAGSNLEEAFEKSRRNYISSQLRHIAQVLRLRRVSPRKIELNKELEDSTYEIMSILTLRRFVEFDSDSMIAFLVAVKDTILRFTPESYIKYITNLEDVSSYNDGSYYRVLLENFYDLQAKVMNICDNALALVGDEKAFYNFLKDRTSAYLIHEFNGQIKPVKYKEEVATIELKDEKKYIIRAKIDNEKSIEFLYESSFLYPYSRCIFIDNPFIIDNLDMYDVLYHSSYKDYSEFDTKSIINSEDIKDRDEVLIDLLINKEVKNFFDDLDIQNKFKDVFEHINKIVPGEFSKATDGYYYVDEGSRLSVKNLATGSKMFFIIKKLLLNGLIDENTMLILDEPESHLHPDWINKFAQILVFLVSKVKVNVLLTTHSPNLMLALNVYAKKMELMDSAHFYIADKMDDEYFSTIKCIDENIGEGYSHLSLPLVRMNLELNELEEE